MCLYPHAIPFPIRKTRRNASKESKQLDQWYRVKTFEIGRSASSLNGELGLGTRATTVRTIGVSRELDLLGIW